MKYLTLILSLLISSAAFAEKLPFQTQDSLSYIITVGDSSNWRKCSKTICNIAKTAGYGRGLCKKFLNLGIIQVNLTTIGVDRVSQLQSCNLAIEQEGEVEALPKLGTSN